MVQRVVLAGIALGPALAVLLFPITALGNPVALALSGAGGVWCFCASFRWRGGRSAASSCDVPLLRRRAAVDDLPEPAVLRAMLAQRFAVPDAMTSPREQRISQTVYQLAQRMTEGDLALLSDEQLRSLAAVQRLLRASPQEAGALAQRFEQPAAVLDLRDVVAWALPR
ncbi:hypothetical protein ACN2XU_03605 [Primorskyibacter sp. 2E107]|uniref:hypothetical protein n=1 Tax=Primorskyibacter sp. 2E107 TaxID=3403458 RepID=UPI003AF6E2A6